MKRIFIITSILASAITASAQSKTWSMRECIDYAIDHNITIKQQQNQARQQQIQLDDNRGNHLPTVDASIGQNFSFGRGLTAQNTYENTNTSNTSFQLGASVPIFTGNKIVNAVKLSQLNLDASLADLEKARDDIRTQVAKAYVQILYDMEICDVAQRQIAIDSMQVYRLEQMLKAGKITRGEYLMATEKPLALNFKRSDHKDGIATYFREFLRQYMMAKKPERSKYPSWNIVQYSIDSLAWETDPLYGWCNKNVKKNGEPYNVYTDGLKIFTTLDSRMQKYAEEAVRKHVGGFLQPEFKKENRLKKNAPFTTNLKPSEVKAILDRSMRQSDRYRMMKAHGATEEEIREAFQKPTEMTVFTYRGDIDTIMSPMDSIRYVKSFLRAGFMSMDPRTGAVKAYVGGIDFNHFKYDMVTQGRRQVGSTIKPFLYALSMSNGMSPCDVVRNSPKRFGNWAPRNSSHARVGQMVTLKWALTMSNNWVSAELMSRINPQDFLRILRDFGINTYGIYPSLVLCLGPNEASVCEMVSAYTTFANHGIHTSPIFVSKIEDSDGNVITNFQPRMNEVISEESAYKMLEMLMSVIDHGTGGRLRYKYNIDCQMGGKTGTTNKNADAWFMGFTPSLVSGCWVGGEDRDIHFDTTRMGQGATMALPIWAYYMKKVFADKTLGYDPKETFDIPEDFNPCSSEDDNNGQYSIEDIYE